MADWYFYFSQPMVRGKDSYYTRNRRKLLKNSENGMSEQDTVVL